MQALVMGMNYGMDSKENIVKKKNVLMDYLMMHIRVRIRANRLQIFLNFDLADEKY